MCKVTLNRCRPAIALIVLGADAACAQGRATATEQRLLELAVPTVSADFTFAEHRPPTDQNTGEEHTAGQNAGDQNAASRFTLLDRTVSGESLPLVPGADTERAQDPPGMLTQPW